MNVFLSCLCVVLGVCLGVSASEALPLPDQQAPTHEHDGDHKKREPGKRWREAAKKRFDTNGDGVLDETERQAAQAAMEARALKRFDADGDGKLSQSERQAMRAAREKRKGTKQAKADKKSRKGDKKLKEKADTNKDGVIDEQEKAAFMEEKAQRKQAFLEQYDTDGDGVLSDQERKAAKQERGIAHHQKMTKRLAALKEKNPELFNKIDTDGNGELDKEEMRQWHKKRKHHKKTKDHKAND